MADGAEPGLGVSLGNRNGGIAELLVAEHEAELELHEPGQRIRLRPGDGADTGRGELDRMARLGQVLHGHVGRILAHEDVVRPVRDLVNHLELLEVERRLLAHQELVR